MKKGLMVSQSQRLQDLEALVQLAIDCVVGSDFGGWQIDYGAHPTPGWNGHTLRFYLGQD